GSAAPGVSGVIRANTSITRDGEVFLDARLKLTLDGGLVQILPDENGETIPQSAVANFHPGSIEMQGVVVDMESGSLLIAPGASVTANSQIGTSFGIYPTQLHIQKPNERIYMAPTSAIDVSGLDGVTLKMSENLLTFKPFGNEFADQPLQRQGALRGVS